MTRTPAPAAPAPAVPGGPSAPTPAPGGAATGIEGLPVARWPATEPALARPGHPAPDSPQPGSPQQAQHPSAVPAFALHEACTGLHLGTDRQGSPVALPAIGPGHVRIGVLGESLFGRLLAIRLLAAGARVTAMSRGPALWSALVAAAGSRLALAEDAAGWPAYTPEPPGTGDGPQAFVSDMRRPPPSPPDGGRWCTTVHVRRQVPRHGAFWQRLDAVLTLGADFAEAVAPVCGDAAAQVTAGLAPGEIALFSGAQPRILRPDIAPAETSLLTPGQG